MLILILKALYFFLPAYFANMAPIPAAKLHLPFGRPLSTKLFGESKTWRGFFVAYIGALFALYIQEILYVDKYLLIREISIINYSEISILFYALLFGIGAMTGDVIKSFFKRRFGKKSGDMWFPFDQIDFVIGAIILLYPFHQVSIEVVIILIIVTPLLHLMTNIIAYNTGLKKVWW